MFLLFVDVFGLHGVDVIRAMQEQAVLALLECCLAGGDGRRRIARLLTFLPSIAHITADNILQLFFPNSNIEQVEAIWKSN